MNRTGASARLAEVLGVFFRLGLTSFGGPAAHLGYFHGELVRRRGWVDEAEYADLLALCQFLPGPGSSQLAFALGYRRAGVLGALGASIAFMAPSAALMISFGYGMLHLAALGVPGWLQGLKVAAVAVVAEAVRRMAISLSPDLPRACIAVAAAAVALLFPTSYAQIAALLLGSFAGWLVLRPLAAREAALPAVPASAGSSLARGAVVLALWAVLLAAVLVSPWRGNSAAAVFGRFYRVGSVVVGGAHIVLPLLRAEVVPNHWTTDNVFLAGYGAAQALPGPLFTFSSYLGTVIHAGPGGWRGGLLALLAIFLPAWLLIGGALPWWDRLRSLSPLRAALRGANAAVVGILAAAFYTPVCTSALHSWRHLGLAALAFLALARFRAPAWAIVAACALLGEAAFN